VTKSWAGAWEQGYNSIAQLQMLTQWKQQRKVCGPWYFCTCSEAWQA